MAAIERNGRVKFEKPGRYRIDVGGRLDEHWSDRLGGMIITPSGSGEGTPVTTLIGNLRDQTQLSGILNSLYELHLPILLVKFLKDDTGVG